MHMYMWAYVHVCARMITRLKSFHELPANVCMLCAVSCTFYCVFSWSGSVELCQTAARHTTSVQCRLIKFHFSV